MSTEWIEEYKDINGQALRVALAALYDTQVESEEIGQVRGLAVRTVAKLGEMLGVPGLIAEMEQEPHSVRRRNSPLWGGEK